MNPLAFPSPPRRILLIKPSAIGDVVHTLPILNLLRKRWPEAHIAWLVTPACAGLLEGHPQLSEVIHFDRRRFGRGRSRFESCRCRTCGNIGLGLLRLTGC